MVKPILQNVLVKPMKSSNVLESGLIVPDSCIKDSNRVQIVAVGNGTKLKPMTLKEGQTGYRVKNWGDEIIIDGEKHYLMNQSAIIALQ